MNKQELSDYLAQHFGKAAIGHLKDLAGEGVIDVADVFELCSAEGPSKIVFRAAWLLEEIVYHHSSVFCIVAKDFSRAYPLQKNLSAQRHYSKIAMFMMRPFWIEYYKLSSTEVESIITGSFDWLINEKTPVAIKCNCLDVLFNLSGYEDWILEELKPILEKALLSDSPALLSRTKKVLKKIRK